MGEEEGTHTLPSMQWTSHSQKEETLEGRDFLFLSFFFLLSFSFPKVGGTAQGYLCRLAHFAYLAVVHPPKKRRRH